MATISSSIGTGTQAVGIVRAVVGTVKAVSRDGVERVLQVGDRVFADEMIETADPGAVSILFNNGGHLDLGRDSDVLLDSDVYGPANMDTAEVAASIEAVQQAILAGGDPTVDQEAPAAGGGTEDSSSVTAAPVVERTGEQLTPESGFETRGLDDGRVVREFQVGGEENSLASLAAAPGEIPNHAPVADPLVLSVDEGASMIAGRVTASDQDGDSLTYRLVSDAPAGLVFSADGSFTFDPSDPAYDGLSVGESAEFTVIYEVDDGQGGTDTATLLLTVNGTNDAPTAEPDNVSTDEDTPVTIDVLNNDSDVDGDSLTVTTATAGNGTVTINPDGTLDYAPDAGFNGYDTVTYTISDGHGGTATTTVAVAVGAVNDAPEASPIADQSGDDAEVVNLDVSGHFSDPDGDSLSYSATGLPPGLSIDPATGVISGTLTS
ncbi:MAG TPA: retention module-containing protein, partial [Sedimenticola thiotaurini]|nr:retention module-containing protein [Sedimenticola thiotaurini]